MNTLTVKVAMTTSRSTCSRRFWTGDGCEASEVRSSAQLTFIFQHPIRTSVRNQLMIIRDITGGSNKRCIDACWAALGSSPRTIPKAIKAAAVPNFITHPHFCSLANVDLRPGRGVSTRTKPLARAMAPCIVAYTRFGVTNSKRDPPVNATGSPAASALRCRAFTTSVTQLYLGGGQGVGVG